MSSLDVGNSDKCWWAHSCCMLHRGRTRWLSLTPPPEPPQPASVQPGEVGSHVAMAALRDSTPRSPFLSAQATCRDLSASSPQGGYLRPQSFQPQSRRPRIKICSFVYSLTAACPPPPPLLLPEETPPPHGSPPVFLWSPTSLIVAVFF